MVYSIILQGIAVSAAFMSSASAHFRIPFPGERNSTNWATQEQAPCGGANRTVNPRYLWNPEGSPVDINMFHNASVGAVYYCGKDDCKSLSDFDTLVMEPFDITNPANFCMPALELPSKYNKNGKKGTLQFMFAALDSDQSKYEYMYNCIDIEVNTQGPKYTNQCSNTTSATVRRDAGLASAIGTDAKTKIDKVSTLSFLEDAKTNASSSSSTASISKSSSGSASKTSSSTKKSKGAAAPSIVHFGSGQVVLALVGALLI